MCITTDPLARSNAARSIPSLSWEQVSAWRLAQNHLLERADRTEMLDVLGRIGCVHAQVMSSAELQLAARVEGLSPADVQSALWQDHRLLKTWSLRGTLHLLRREDFPLYVATLDTYVGPFFRKPIWL